MGQPLIARTTIVRELMVTVTMKLVRYICARAMVLIRLKMHDVFCYRRNPLILVEVQPQRAPPLNDQTGLLVGQAWDLPTFYRGYIVFILVLTR